MKGMPDIKICGMTRATDVEPALRAGASWLGMIFAPGSPRRMTVEQALDIKQANQHSARLVGVFQNQTTDDVLRIAERIGLDAIQLHGGYAAGDAQAVAGRGFRVIWAEPAATFLDPARPPFERPDGVDITLMDSARAGQFGGTGESFDWASAAAPDRPFWVAGGLEPRDIATVMTTLAPDGLDFGSKLETVPGKKDLAKLDALGRAIALWRETLFGEPI